MGSASLSNQQADFLSNRALYNLEPNAPKLDHVIVVPYKKEGDETRFYKYYFTTEAARNSVLALITPISLRVEIKNYGSVKCYITESQENLSELTKTALDNLVNENVLIYETQVHLASDNDYTQALYNLKKVSKPSKKSLLLINSFIWSFGAAHVFSHYADLFVNYFKRVRASKQPGVAKLFASLALGFAIAITELLSLVSLAVGAVVGLIPTLIELPFKNSLSQYFLRENFTNKFKDIDPQQTYLPTHHKSFLHKQLSNLLLEPTLQTTLFTNQHIVKCAMRTAFKLCTWPSRTLLRLIAAPFNYLLDKLSRGKHSVNSYLELAARRSHSPLLSTTVEALRALFTTPLAVVELIIGLPAVLIGAGIGLILWPIVGAKPKPNEKSLSKGDDIGTDTLAEKAQTKGPTYDCFQLHLKERPAVLNSDRSSNASNDSSADPLLREPTAPKNNTVG